MKWVIEGADADNGEEVRVEVDADTSEQARSLAAQQNLLIASILPAAIPSIEYAGTQTPAMRSYRSLEFAAMILRITAYCGYGGGALLLLLFLISLTERNVLIFSSGRWFQYLMGLLASMIPIAVGGLIHGFAEGLLILRDWARRGQREA